MPVSFKMQVKYSRFETNRLTVAAQRVYKFPYIYGRVLSIEEEKPDVNTSCSFTEKKRLTRTRERV